ncbi:MAG: hypothetical protein JWN14_1704, partial [Chthonomonadales bacterium]|nr:hypothetical protein [Chthonomonadales bacterium]
SVPFGGLATTGNAIQTQSAAAGQTDNQRVVGTTLGADGTTVYASFLIRPTESVNSGGHGSYGGFALGGLFVGKLPSGFYGLSNLDGSNPVSSAVAPALNTTAFLVVRITFQSGVDKVELFVSPVPSQPIPTIPDATKSDLDIGSTSTVDVLADHGFTIDELRLGDTYDDVTPSAAVPSSAIVFQSQTTNQVGIWAMAGTNVVDSKLVNANAQAGWSVVGTGDINQDGKPDLVFQNQTTGRLVVWYLNGSFYLGGEVIAAVPDAGFKVSGVADMDGDGKPDLILQNQATGRVALWYMDGASYQGGTLLPKIADAGLKMVGAADFDFNGTADLLFQDQTTGAVVVWYMNRTVFTSSATLATVPNAGWNVVAMADYNNDGRVDLVFQNSTTNQIVLWYLKDFAYIGGAVILPIPDPDFKVVGPR